MGNATKYFFKYGDNLLDLVKVNGVVKFTDNTVIRLAPNATKYIENIEPNKVMLGKEFFEETIPYYQRASDEGYKYFRFSDEEWNGLLNIVNQGSEEMWKINKKFIDDAVRQSNQIYLSHNPFDPNVVTRTYKRELDYLKQEYSASFTKINDSLWKVLIP